MAEVVLNGSRIVAIAREFVSRTMSQHVRMNRERQSSFLARALHQPIEPVGREGCSSFINKYEWRLRSFTLELAQCAHFVAPDGMGGRLAVFGPTHMQGRAIKIDLRPFEVAKLGSPQPMS